MGEHMGRCEDEKKKQEKHKSPDLIALLCVCAAFKCFPKRSDLRRRKSRLTMKAFAKLIRTRTVAQSIRGNYMVSTNTVSPPLSKSIVHFPPQQLIEMRSSGRHSRMRKWAQTGTALFRTAIYKRHTHTHVCAELDSTYNRTQRKWTCSAVLVQHREKGNRMIGLEGKGRKDTGDVGTGVRSNTRWVGGLL